MRYEKALAKAIPPAEAGPWFEFSDRNGPGWCQPDLVLEGKDSVLVLEAKFSWVASGHSQIGLLYRPVLQKALGKPVLGMVVCRNLRPELPASIQVVTGLRAGMEFLRAGKAVVLHWIGDGRLWPPI